MNGSQFGTDTVIANGGAIEAGIPSVTVANNILANVAGLGVSGSNSLTLSGTISGSGGLTKTGVGTLLLIGTNTYAGFTNLNGGTLSLFNTGALGSSHLYVGGTATLVISTTGVFNNNLQLLTGNSLTINNGSLVLLNNGIGGGGSLTKTGSGTLMLSGLLNHAGTTTINAGTLALQAGAVWASTGTVNLADTGTAFDVSAASINQSIGGLSGVSGSNVSLGASTLTLAAAGNHGFSGTIGGTGGIVKQGIGTQTLSGANTYIGGTTITGGTLALGAGGSLAAAGAVNLGASGATFDISAAGANQTIGALSGVAGTTVALGGNSLTFGDAADQTFAGVITGNGGITKQGSGSQTLTGANTYTGTTTINAGTLALGAGGSLASTSSMNLGSAGATFDISSGGSQTIGALTGLAGTSINLGANTLTFGDANTRSFMGTISGTGGIVHQGTGLLILGGNNTYTGGTTINGGTLTLGGGGSLAATGAVNLATVGTGFDISTAGNQTIGGLSGAIATTVSLGSNTLTFGGSGTDIYNGVFSGTGNIIKQGSGTQVLGGASTFSGSTTVAAGTLELNAGSLAGAVNVQSGATLSGSGRVGSLEVGAGGVLSLGTTLSRTGTLNVDGNITLNTGATYAVDLAGNGNSDLLNISGIAYLYGGGLSITALDAATSYQEGQTYTILSANGGYSGSFTDVTNNSAFLNYQLLYDLNNVQVQITLAGDSDSLFSEKANTPNQASVAHALDTLDQSGSSLALYNALLPLSGDEARLAYDELAGASHATGQAGMVNSANTLNNVITNRMRSASNGVAATPSPVTPLGYAEEKRPARENDPFATYSTAAKADEFDHGRFSVWGTGLGSWGKVDGVFGGADTDTRTSGLLFGADGMVSDQWRVGAFGGYSYSSFDTGADDQRSRNYHAGLYANSQWGELAFRSGINYTYHDVDTTRVLSVLNQRLSGDYSANTVSAFGELGYRFDLGSAALEPFAGISHTWNRTGSFTETGGTAALTVDGRSMNTTATTLGLRASSDFDLDGTLVTARGTIGWVHAFGDVDPVSTARFASGDAFSVSGTPIDRNAALLELGLDVALTPNATLGLGYNGQIGANATDHAFNAGLKVRF